MKSRQNVNNITEETGHFIVQNTFLLDVLSAQLVIVLKNTVHLKFIKACA